MTTASHGIDPAKEAPVRAASLGLLGAQLAALAFHPVITLWRANVVAGIGGGPLLLVATATTLAAWLLVLIVWRARGRRLLWMTGSAVSAGLVAFFGWGSFLDLTRDVGPPRGIGAVSVAAFLSVTLIVAAYRFGATLFVRTTIAALAAALIVPSTFALVATRHGAVPPHGIASNPVAPGPKRADRDVFIVVLDGYGRADNLRRYFGFDDERFASTLAARAIETAADARPNYSLTYAAVPSALSMDYLYTDDRPIRSDEIRWSNRISGGDNRVVRSFKLAGYRYIHFESGLGGSACGPQVDECHPAPFINETTWALFYNTPLSHLLRSRYGHAFSTDSLDRLRRLIELARHRSREPRLVFAHILLPHPPLFVTRDCSVHVREGLDGLTIGHPRFLRFLERRKDAYIEQVRCVNRRLLELVDAMPRDAIVAFFGDHGPGSQAQLVTPIGSWTDEQIRERMGIFLAYRLGAGCREPGPGATPINLLRDVVACAIGADVPRLPDRSFLVPPAPASGVAPPPLDVTGRLD